MEGRAGGEGRGREGRKGMGGKGKRTTPSEILDPPMLVQRRWKQCSLFSELSSIL